MTQKPKTKNQSKIIKADKTKKLCYYDTKAKSEKRKTKSKEY